jgi:hypothetical protein
MIGSGPFWGIPFVSGGVPVGFGGVFGAYESSKKMKI